MRTTSRSCAGGIPSRSEGFPGAVTPPRPTEEHVRVAQTLMRAAQAVLERGWEPPNEDADSGERGLRTLLRQASGTRPGFYNARLYERAEQVLCARLGIAGAPELHTWETAPGREASDVVDVLIAAAESCG